LPPTHDHARSREPPARRAGERFGHRSLVGRAWELRHDIRGGDAIYIGLAEALGATLITLDRRLADAPGPECPIEVIEG
jgi:predicted nucleic acid-binding protein